MNYQKTYTHMIIMTLTIMITLITLITMKNTNISLIQLSCFLSSMSFTTLPLIKSNVNVELEVSTSDDKVDIDAESTNTITIPISISDKDANMVGIMESYTILPFSA